MTMDATNCALCLHESISHVMYIDVMYIRIDPAHG